MTDSKSKHEKLIRTLNLIKKIKGESKKYKENSKDLNDMQIAKKKFDDILEMDKSFEKSFSKGKGMQKEINDAKLNYPEMKLNVIQDNKINNDNNLIDSNTNVSNYDFYNNSYKLLNLPKKLEYDKKINFNIYPDYHLIQKDINNFFYYLLIVVIAFGTIYVIIKIYNFTKKTIKK